MTSWKASGATLLVAGLRGGIKYLFDMAEKNRHPEC